MYHSWKGVSTAGQPGPLESQEKKKAQAEAKEPALKTVE